MSGADGKLPPHPFDSAFISVIQQQLVQPGERGLSQAYELGRQAFAHGLGILDVFSLYEEVFKALVIPAPAAGQAELATTVGAFFRELLSSYEMILRGYRAANLELQRLNAELKGAYAELQAKQLQLVHSAKMASLGELVAGVAHEINNPLAFVMSHVGTARTSLDKALLELEPLLPAEASKHWQRATTRLRESELGMQRIQELVVKLRAFSRLDEGQRKKVSIRECVDSVLMILRHRFHERIVIETDFREPDRIECFPSLLNQALMNLVANAIDAIEGRGRIWISTGRDGDTYAIRIADTGCGIPEHLRERVLEPFFTTKPVGLGTGLGLSITYSIIREHRGALELQPREGGGTLATIRLPLDPSIAASAKG